MAEDKKEAVFEKPTSQLDLEARQADDYRSPLQLNFGNDHNEAVDRGGFVGVDPVYQNAATEAQRPFHAEEGPESVVEEQAGVVEGNEWKGDEAVPEVEPLDSTESEDEGDKGEGRGQGAATAKTTTAKKAASAPSAPSQPNK